MTIGRHQHRSQAANNSPHVARVLGFKPNRVRSNRLPNEVAKQQTIPPPAAVNNTVLSPRKNKSSPYSNRCNVVTPPKKGLSFQNAAKSKKGKSFSPRSSPHLFNPSSPKGSTNKHNNNSNNNGPSNESSPQSLKIELAAFGQSVEWNETALLWKVSQSSSQNKEELSLTLKQVEQEMAAVIFGLAQQYWHTVSNLVSPPSPSEKLNDVRARQQQQSNSASNELITLPNKEGPTMTKAAKKVDDDLVEHCQNGESNDTTSPSLVAPSTPYFDSVPESPVQLLASSPSYSPASSSSSRSVVMESELEAGLEEIVGLKAENKALTQRNDELRVALSSVLEVATANNHTNNDNGNGNGDDDQVTTVTTATTATDLSMRTTTTTPQRPVPSNTSETPTLLPSRRLELLSAALSPQTQSLAASLTSPSSSLRSPSSLLLGTPTTCGSLPPSSSAVLSAVRTAHAIDLRAAKRGCAEQVAAVKKEYAAYHERCKAFCDKVVATYEAKEAATVAAAAAAASDKATATVITRAACQETTAKAEDTAIIAAVAVENSKEEEEHSSSGDASSNTNRTITTTSISSSNISSSSNSLTEEVALRKLFLEVVTGGNNDDNKEVQPSKEEEEEHKTPSTLAVSAVVTAQNGNNKKETTRGVKGLAGGMRMAASTMLEAFSFVAMATILCLGGVALVAVVGALMDRHNNTGPTATAGSSNSSSELRKYLEATEEQVATYSQACVVAVTFLVSKVAALFWSSSTGNAAAPSPTRVQLLTPVPETKVPRSSSRP